MAHDSVLADRIRSILAENTTISEKKMFGGLSFFVNGNMACGVHKDHLVVRVGPDRYMEALADESADIFDITGRAMKGWVMVNPAGFSDNENLQNWVTMGIEFAGTLPPK